MEDEASLQTAIQTYKLQLSQVELALQSTDESGREDLELLQADFQQLIQLTEESLLAVKKSRLLAMLDSGGLQVRKASNCSSAAGSASNADIDSEFAAFQEAIAGDTSDIPAGEVSSSSIRLNLGHNLASEETSGNLSGTDCKSDNDDNSTSDEDNVDTMSGTKCRAPYSHSWGEMTYHNAVVLNQEAGESQVRVLFCNPTHNSMRPCPFFLEGECRFDDLHCRYSHGALVSVDSLETYLEPDYSTVNIGSHCLAHDLSDDIWYRATVVDILSDGRYHVMFDANHDERKLEVQDVLPLTNHSEVVISDEESKNDRLYFNEPDDAEDLPVYLWRPGQTTDTLGGWEKHTRGIASRLMAQMGYIVGQGLGKNSDGRAEPVPIQLLPQGKSLDKIMELKAIAGDRDLYDVSRKQRRKQKVVDAGAANSYVSKKAKSSAPVFDFINVKLSHKKSGTSKGLTKHGSGNKTAIDVKHIAAHELDKKSDKHINVQLCKTQEEMRNAEREIKRLHIALERNEKQDNIVAKQLRNKLVSMQSYVEQLRTSESFIKNNQASRQARNALAKF